MKTLQIFCTANNLILQPVKYRHQFGYCRRKGYDICRPDGFILASFEPYESISGNDKWYLRHTHEGYKGQRYIARITAKFLVDNIDTSAASFFRNSSVIVR